MAQSAETGNIFDDENEPTITIKEYIDGVEAQELEADMVLGGDEGQECTYPKGYVTRQAIFSCLTCAPAGNSGVCTACSLICHDGHEVVELWTRRQFRCDCGNSKFGDIQCKLVPNKDPENPDNSYNQNYMGLYCLCHRPYPDPEGEDLGEMIQCCLCEDWFHESHLGLASTEQLPRDEEGDPIYDDFVCQDCSSRCSFLLYYEDCVIPPSVTAQICSNGEATETNKNTNENTQDKIEAPALIDLKNGEEAETHNTNEITQGTSEALALTDTKNGVIETGLETAGVDKESVNVHVLNACSTKINLPENTDMANGIEMSNGEKSMLGQSTMEHSNLHSSLPSNSHENVKSGKEKEEFCKLSCKKNINLESVVKKGPLFLGKNWREQLCRCCSCSDVFAQHRISFLLDKGDALEEYEKMAQQKREEKLQQREGVEAAFLKKLGHTQQIELVNGFNEMKNELANFFGSLDGSKTVTDADIREVFDNLRRKRQRLV